jgi:hypothetical protein
MKTLISLLISTCASLTAFAQQPSPSPSPSIVTRVVYRHRLPKRIAAATVVATTTATPEPAADFFVGEARVNVTKDETVVRLAMAQHGSVLIELPANDGPRYIIPGDPEMATVDEKALERNKRAIVVRPGSLFVPPLPNHKARTPAATVTAQMRSGLVVTFLFFPVEDLAQNVHRCVLSYNRDEVVARRRAAGLPVNLDNNSTSSERRDSTGQSNAPISISVEDNGDSKPADSEAGKSKESKLETRPPTVTDVRETVGTAPTSSAPVSTLDKKVAEQNERITTLTREALAGAVKKPKQFKHWTKPAHGLALSVVRQVDPKNEFQIVVIGVRNLNPEGVQLVSGSPDLLVEMVDEQAKPINLESIKKLHTEVSEGAESVAAGKTVYYAITYVAPVLGARQQIKVVVSQTNAADEPASIALSSVGR